MSQISALLKLSPLVLEQLGLNCHFLCPLAIVSSWLLWFVHSQRNHEAPFGGDLLWPFPTGKPEARNECYWGGSPPGDGLVYDWENPYLDLAPNCTLLHFLGRLDWLRVLDYR